MTDTNPHYRRLVKQLSGTRKTFTHACRDADVDTKDIDYYQLNQLVSQCTHCDIWSSQTILDLDDNPICVVCLRLTGL